MARIDDDDEGELRDELDELESLDVSEAMSQPLSVPSAAAGEDLQAELDDLTELAAFADGEPPPVKSAKGPPPRPAVQVVQEDQPVPSEDVPAIEADEKKKIPEKEEEEEEEQERQEKPDADGDEEEKDQKIEEMGKFKRKKVVGPPGPVPAPTPAPKPLIKKEGVLLPPAQPIPDISPPEPPMVELLDVDDSVAKHDKTHRAC